jgi:hypothetical protein
VATSGTENCLSMGMTTLTTENCLWLKFDINTLEWASAVYVEDVVQIGTSEFDRLSDGLSARYDAKAKEYGDGRIAGI